MRVTRIDFMEHSCVFYENINRLIINNYLYKAGKKYSLKVASRKTEYERWNTVYPIESIHIDDNKINVAL